MKSRVSKSEEIELISILEKCTRFILCNLITIFIILEIIKEDRNLARLLLKDCNEEMVSLLRKNKKKLGYLKFQLQ